MGSNKAKSEGSASLIVLAIAVAIVFLALAWPYYLGTWLAVNMGAGNPSTARSVIGWVFESIWLVGLVSIPAWPWLSTKREEAEERQQKEAQRQHEAEFGRAGVHLYKQAEASVAKIAATEAARKGWLGDQSDYDFRLDLEAIAANLRRAQEIRKVIDDASSVTNFTASDDQMLRSAKDVLAKLDDSVTQRVKLIDQCAQQASEIDRALVQDRENAKMAKRREDIRDRLGSIVHDAGAVSKSGHSDAADAVSARVAAFHELKAVVDRYRTVE